MTALHPQESKRTTGHARGQESTNKEERRHAF